MQPVILNLNFHLDLKSWKEFIPAPIMIGKRYRRQDAIGTPFCITVDHQTLEDQTVTIRYRDSMLQDRIPVSQIDAILHEKVTMRIALEKLNSSRTETIT